MGSADIVRAIAAASLGVATGSVPAVFAVFVLSATLTVFNPAGASLLPAGFTALLTPSVRA